MLRELEFQPEYGLIGAGAVNASLIGRLPGRTRALGPVAAVSLRVASRISNTLRAGRPVRSADELRPVRVVLVHSPFSQLEALLRILRNAALEWRGKSIIFCDCGAPDMEYFVERGASIASLQTSPVPGTMVVEGSAPALNRARAFVRELKLKAIEIVPGASGKFGAAMMLGRGAITPLIDTAADMLRACGLRDTDAVEMASAAFAQTARDYAHSGKQSWEWHVREPDPDALRAQFDASGDAIKEMLARLVLLGMETFGKHPEAAEVARRVIEGTS